MIELHKRCYGRQREENIRSQRPFVCGIRHVTVRIKINIHGFAHLYRLVVIENIKMNM